MVIAPGVVPPGDETDSQFPPWTVVADTLKVSALVPELVIWTCCVAGTVAFAGIVKATVAGLAVAVAFEAMVKVTGITCAAGKFGEVMVICPL
jgi:hypothetical protein